MKLTQKTRRNWFVAFATVGVALAGPSIALAQSPRAEAGAVEVATGLTINGVKTDVNAEPACLALSAPCTHSKSVDWGGFGLDLNLSREVFRHLAFTGAVSVNSYNWDSTKSLATHQSETNVVAALLVGPTLRTSFTHPWGRQRESDRVFAQLLVGAEHDSVFEPHPVVEVAVGADSAMHFASQTRLTTIRMAVAYRFVPGETYSAGGVRFTFAFVFGPHQVAGRQGTD